MITKVLGVLVLTAFTVEAQFVIERAERDIFRNLTSCSDATPDFCYSLHADESDDDHCICRCKPLYPMYRNPDVEPSGGTFISKGGPACVWHSNHRYECFHIRKLKPGLDETDNERALEFDFSKPGSVTVYTEKDMKSCAVVETAIKLPEDYDFTVVNGLLSAVRLRSDRVLFQWNTTNVKYKGAVLRGVFRNCTDDSVESNRCFVGKISGVYTGDCTVRASNGECCIFPFTYKGQTYENCTSVDNTVPWCAVRLPFNNDSNWRKNCTDPSQSSSSSFIVSVSQTPSLTGLFSMVQTSLLSTSIPLTTVASLVTAEPSQLGLTSSIRLRSTFISSILRSYDVSASFPSSADKDDIFTTSELFGSRSVSDSSSDGDVHSTYQLTSSVYKAKPSISEGTSPSQTISLPSVKPGRKDSGISLIVLVVAILIGVSFLIIFLACCIFLCIRRRKRKQKEYSNVGLIESQRSRGQSSQQADSQVAKTEEVVEHPEMNISDIADEEAETAFIIPEKPPIPESTDSKKSPTDFERQPSYMTFKL